MHVSDGSSVRRSAPLQSAGADKRYRNVELKSADIRWKHFPDGWPNLFIDNVKQCAGKDVIFIGSFHSQQVIFDQLSIIYAFPRYLAHSFTLILPYFPTGTMERVDTEGQIATARVSEHTRLPSCEHTRLPSCETLSKMLSSIPLTARGPAQIVIYDIHALQERFYFSDNVIPRLETAIPLLQRRIGQLPDHDKVSIAFPDQGAFKRFHLLFANFPTITCSKLRDGDKRIVTVTEGSAEDRHVVIVDDLVMTGGTLMECAKALKARGANTISAFVTHAVFPNQSWRRFTAAATAEAVVNGEAEAVVNDEVEAVVNDGARAVVNGDAEDAHQPLLKHFWITDSIPTVADYSSVKPFELLSLSSVITTALLSYDLQQ
ncbi:uncharacterized protein LOC135830484 isoform X2 [Sycon ciliatum]|uniref:uncharacterized protein LOC135830484 isoform X2 n=1 Tax=Sycon ciliatum TaxID=27933 RepID=UPI0031F669F0